MTKPKNDNPPVEPVFVAPEDPDAFDAAIDAHRAEQRKYFEALDSWQKARPVLSLEGIRETKDLKEGPLFIPEWDGCVITRSLTRKEAYDLDVECRQDGVLQSEKFTRRLIDVGMVDPKVSPDEPLHAKHPVALRRIADDVLVKSGMLQEVAAELAEQFQE